MRFIYFFYDFVKCVCLIVFSVFFHKIFHDFFCDFYSKLDLYGTFQFEGQAEEEVDEVVAQVEVQQDQVEGQGEEEVD